MLTAIRDGDLVRLRELVEADPAAARAVTTDGSTVLQVALYSRRLDVIKILLDAGALQTVHEAAVLGDLDLLARLIDADADLLEAPAPDGFLPLHLAAHFAQHDAVQWLLERGARLGALSTNANRNTALHAAAAGGVVATARILLSSGADADARDAGGNSPLHIAAANGAVPVVQALLDGGADPAATNAEGETPIELAKGRGKKEVAEILEAAQRAEA